VVRSAHYSPTRGPFPSLVNISQSSIGGHHGRRQPSAQVVKCRGQIPGPLHLRAAGVDTIQHNGSNRRPVQAAVFGEAGNDRLTGRTTRMGPATAATNFRQALPALQGADRFFPFDIRRAFDQRRQPLPTIHARARRTRSTLCGRQFSGICPRTGTPCCPGSLSGPPIRRPVDAEPAHPSTIRAQRPSSTYDQDRPTGVEVPTRFHFSATPATHPILHNTEFSSSPRRWSFCCGLMIGALGFNARLRPDRLRQGKRRFS